MSRLSEKPASPSKSQLSGVSVSRHEYLGEEIVVVLPNKKPKLASESQGEVQHQISPSNSPAASLQERLSQVDMHPVGQCTNLSVEVCI